jgi:hypothetical protein
VKNNTKQFHLINFATRNATFGNELQGELQANHQQVYSANASDYLLDLGNGSTIRPQLVMPFGVVTTSPETTFFLRRRKPLKFYSSLLTQFSLILGANVLNHARYTEHYDNISKQSQSINLVKNGFRIPRTIICNGESVTRFRSYIESELSYPIVLKGKGSCGNKVWKVNSFYEILEHLNSVSPEVKEAVILQEFIKNSYQEYRVVFMKEQVVAVVVRSSEAFLNNHAQGGNVSTVNLPDDELARCREAARISGLDYLGVDYMKDENGDMIFVELQTGPSLNVTKEINPNAVKTISQILMAN